LRFPSADHAAPILSAVQFLWPSLHCSPLLPLRSPHSAVQLRRNPQGQLGLGFCELGRAFKRRVQPREQIAIDEQLVAQQRGQIRKRPAECRHQLQVPQDQHGNQRRPDLGFNRVRVCPKKCFDLQVLFDRLEKQLHLPAILVDGRDRCPREVEVVGQESERSLAFLIPDLHDPEEMLPVGNGLGMEVDDLILQDISPLGHRSVLNHLERGVIFQASDEVDALKRQLDGPLIVDVAPVHDHNPASLESEPASYLDIAGLAVGDDGERWQVAVMVQEQVEFDGAFRSPELGPVEQRKGQVDDAGIQTHQLVLEPEFLAASVASPARLALCQELLEYGLAERPGTVDIRVSQSGTFRGIRNSQVLEFAFTAGQAPADLAEAVGTAELAEEHGDKLAPAREAFGGVVGAMLPHGLFEFEAREELQQLRENARKSRHGRASLVDRLFGENQSYPSQCPPCTFHFLPGTATELIKFPKSVLDKSEGA
jgi:hypothetical protein